MTFVSRFAPATRLALGVLALGVSSFVPGAQAATNFVAPGILSHGQNLGLETPSTKLNLTVWLNLHNKSELDARVKDLYTPGSASFHQWLTVADLKKYAPTPAEVETVQKSLSAHNLQVTHLDPLGMSIRFTGAVSDVESAFGVKISKYQYQGKTLHVTSTEPKLSGAAASLMHSLGGVNSGKGKPLFVKPMNLKTGKSFPGVQVTKNSKLGANGIFFDSQCFYAPSTTTLTGVNAFDDVTPVTANYTGLNYGANPNNTDQGQLPPCGYSAAQVQDFYGLGTAYNRGYTGKGETVVVIDMGNNAQALPDSNIFNSIEGLPQFDSTNFTEYNPYNVTVPAWEFGTDQETDLDVQWVHASAPGAKIALVDTFDDEEDIQGGILYAVENHLGSIISLSYGYPEYLTGDLATEIFGELGEMAAASGIALNVSSGDDGDFLVYGLPAPDTNAWGDSPWVTSVGGTTIGTDPTSGAVYHLGWGNNQTAATFGTGYIVDPPTAESTFYAGSGGGASQYWPKPSFESSLPGTQRLIPDVSALADPFTGAEYVYDDPSTGETYIGAIGGTSLATPIFSGMWAILDQYAGSSLGQAAPYLAAAGGTPLLTDVLPLSDPYNLTASITDQNGTTKYSSADLAQPLQGESGFVVSLWDADTYGDYVALSFGTDSSLLVTPGWDDVTGWGTPNIGVIFSVLP